MAGATKVNVTELVKAATEYAKNPDGPTERIVNALAEVTGKDQMETRSNFEFRGKEKIDPVVTALMLATGSDEKDTARLLNAAKTAKGAAQDKAVDALTKYLNTDFVGDFRASRAKTHVPIKVDDNDSPAANNFVVPAKDVQTMLQALGFPLKKFGADGYVGAEMYDALDKARQAMGSPHQGDKTILSAELEVLQRKAQEAIDQNKIPAAAPSPLAAQIVVSPREIEVVGGKPMQIKDVQRMLLEAGHSLPEHGADGFDGREFRTALNNFRTQQLDGRNLGDAKIYPDELQRLKEAKIGGKGEELVLDGKKSGKADMSAAKQQASEAIIKASLGEAVDVASHKSQPRNVEQQQAVEFPSRGRR